ncbi:hypothetical protein I305_04076 [Cryptococcus gattii E566]|uniref:Uncharacterized protein n=2 Tax=Cryptococcus gattii TaxID=37769 RepID=E6R2I4_CRYGW|nr:Hypothetical Protein CGB_C0040C [Cryptococcus gattii WM276]ADV20781.1 Hypothetical Protein CGB_C0040C [Cryptococcus gattii WM276]KIR82392.1 hypothetical protein I306_00504 [Cryptococcus gattii EJB2]KIY33210.1 hypothetical protein I305_04076 [Cryptococcus gattii E566]
MTTCSSFVKPASAMMYSSAEKYSSLEHSQVSLDATVAGRSRKADLDMAKAAEVVDDYHHISTVRMMMAPETLWIMKAGTHFEVNVRAVHDSATIRDLVTFLEPMRYASPLCSIRPVDEVSCIINDGSHGTVTPFMNSASYMRQASASASPMGLEDLDDFGHRIDWQLDKLHPHEPENTLRLLFGRVAELVVW